VAGFSLGRVKFSSRIAHVGFILDNVLLGQAYLRALRFPLSIIILGILHTGLSLMTDAIVPYEAPVPEDFLTLHLYLPCLS
jgi:hypothetical protein